MLWCLWCFVAFVVFCGVCSDSGHVGALPSFHVCITTFEFLPGRNPIRIKKLVVWWAEYFPPNATKSFVVFVAFCGVLWCLWCFVVFVVFCIVLWCFVVFCGVCDYSGHVGALPFSRTYNFFRVSPWIFILSFGLQQVRRQSLS